MRLVLGQGVKLAIAGSAIGLFSAVALGDYWATSYMG